MSFLDSNGLSYFYKKIKEKFVRSINSITPDSNGNVAITNVATADNLTSPDGQTSYDTYIYRTSGGDVSLESGQAELVYIDGNVEISGRVAESISASANNGIIISVDAPIWRASDYGSESGTYTFNYVSSSNTWSPALASYGLSASNIKLSTISVSVSGIITSAEVNKATWETQTTTTGVYYFIYEEGNWKLSGNTVTLSNYGITITGTPQEGDVITINYTAATPDSTATIVYIKGEQGIINVAKPSYFEATGFNQFDSNTMVLNNMTIANGYITSSSGNYIGYCKAVGGVTNGYVAYSSGEYITNIGWCSAIPQEGREVVTANASVTSTVASIPFDEDGYVVVVVSDISGLCIHPKWSGIADEEYIAYVAPSSIAFPSTGTLNSLTYSLPLATYGMPAVGNVADRLNLETKTYIKKIGQYAYTPSNLSIVQSMGVDYDYDNTNIFYVLPNSVTYDVSVNPNYIVNDWGTEEFVGTTVPITAQTLYGQNLRDKLRNDVELKKMVFTNVSVSSAFISDDTYSDYGYRKAITLTGVTESMIPEVVLNVEQATSGMFAPVAQSYNGGIYLYANSVPDSSFTIPTIIIWR